MSDTHSEHGTDRLLPLLLVALVPLLAFFPPETRGEALAGCGLLIGLAGLRGMRGNSATLFTTVFAIVSFGLCSATIRQSLSFALWPLAMGMLALAIGLAARRSARDSRLLTWVTWALILSGASVSLHAIYQSFWGFEALLRLVDGDPHYPDRAAVLTRLGRGRAFAAFATPAALGGYLAMTLPVSVGVAIRSKGVARLGAGSLCLLQAAALLASASATATAALIGALAVALWRIRAVGRLLLPAGLVLCLLLAGVVWLRGERLIDATDRQGPIHQRAGNVRVAAEIARDHPWLGAGVGGYAETYPRYRVAGDNESRRAHNLIAELVAEWGIPVGLALSGLFFAIFVGPLWRCDSDALRLPLAVGLAAFALQNLADFGAFMPSLLWTAALLAGVLARPVGAERRAPAPTTFVSACALIAAMLVAIGSGLALELRRDARAEAFAGRLDVAMQLAERGVRRAPWNADGVALLAGLEVDAAVGEVPSDDRVATRLDAAIALAPNRASLRALRARWRIERDDHHGAWADLECACRLYPREERYCLAAREWRERLIGGTEK